MVSKTGKVIAMIKEIDYSKVKSNDIILITYEVPLLSDISPRIIAGLTHNKNYRGLNLLNYSEEKPALKNRFYKMLIKNLFRLEFIFTHNYLSNAGNVQFENGDLVLAVHNTVPLEGTSIEHYLHQLTLDKEFALGFVADVDGNIVKLQNSYPGKTGVVFKGAKHSIVKDDHTTLFMLEKHKDISDKVR